MRQSRRGFLRGAGALGVGFLGGQLPFAGHPALAAGGGADDFGALQGPDANGLMLPPGFTSRVVAVAGQSPVAGASATWHRAPDGGATFPTSSGGWVYVSNSEVDFGGGGVRVIEFDSSATLVNAYSILSGTSRNCAGGPTPWGTWLSCEETSTGLTYECDPLSPGSQGVARAALGTYKHEAAAVDPTDSAVYLTEDRGDGLLYRFRPDSFGDLSAGPLEALEILGSGSIAPGEVREVTWHDIPEPNPTSGLPTRYQISQVNRFNRGEGIWYGSGFMYFASTGDHRVWALDCANQTIEILYDRATSSSPELTQPDNIFVSPTGDVYVAEDSGNLELVAFTPSGAVKPAMRIVGHGASEVAGPALSPDGTRMYFSSQSGPTPTGNNGITYEIEGPFVPPPAQLVPALGILPGLALATALGFAARFALGRNAEAEER
ncbi:MAG: DUF839 domain-containing protein [Myxococcales bacterium]|nr:DUF839 domain-containing protein [Myxococcales bacterium]